MYFKLGNMSFSFSKQEEGWGLNYIYTHFMQQSLFSPSTGSSSSGSDSEEEGGQHEEEIQGDQENEDGNEEEEEEEAGGEEADAPGASSDAHQASDTEDNIPLPDNLPADLTQVVPMHLKW